jgi:Domain of unknown function (DUF4331)
MKKQLIISLFVFLALASTGLVVRMVNASDHDDGENDQKSRSLNLTDHFVFREFDQDAAAAKTDLIFVQNSNPRSLPQQQYYFSVNAHYDFHVSRVADKTKAPTGSDDVTFRFDFGAPDATAFTQPITFTVLNGTTTVGSATTTAAGGANVTTNFTKSAAGTLTTNTETIGGSSFTFFAGHREDPFFFDVERFFQVRSWLIGTFITKTSPTLAATCAGAGPFNAASCAPDFTKNYNVNAIVLRVPIAFLQSSSETTFDTWSTISVKQP